MANVHVEIMIIIVTIIVITVFCKRGFIVIMIIMIIIIIIKGEKKCYMLQERQRFVLITYVILHFRFLQSL